MKLEQRFENRLGAKGRQGFTLVEVLIVLVVISILMALLFPAFKGAQERAAQSSCASNLKNIYMAVSQYKLDERAYPGTIGALLPGNDTNINVLANTAESPTINGVPNSCETPVSNDGSCMNIRGTGYLKSGDSLVCPDDDRDGMLVSSYGDISTGYFKTSGDATYPDEAAGAWTGTPATPARPQADAAKEAFLSRYVWNFWGYDENGVAFRTSDEARAFIDADKPNRKNLLAEPTRSLGTSCNGSLASEACYERRRNPIGNSLSNRYAPGNTIITHCIFHRVQMANNLENPANLYPTVTSAPEDAAGARDIVLRLDGSAKALDVVSWNQVANGVSKWNTQEAN